MWVYAHKACRSVQCWDCKDRYIYLSEALLHLLKLLTIAHSNTMQGVPIPAKASGLAIFYLNKRIDYNIKFAEAKYCILSFLKLSLYVCVCVYMLCVWDAHIIQNRASFSPGMQLQAAQCGCWEWISSNPNLS